MHHPDHDHSLIAGLAADDLTPTEHTRAQALLDSCTECSALRDDLLAIAQATRALPPQRAPRDFRITTEQAARLHRTGWMARLLAPFGRAGSVARPLAATFTTLGLVGVFVAAALPSMLGGAASMAAPQPEGAGTGAGAVSAPDAVASTAPGAMFGPAGPSLAAGADGDDTKSNVQPSSEPLLGVTSGGSSGGDGRDLGSEADRVDAPLSRSNPLLLGSAALLGVGLGLFALRFAGRRLR